ncbi:MAG: DUF58 domain-containing protein [Planctomycetota bacterium]
MSASRSESRVLPISVGAGMVVQLLSAMASFLAAFVLPINFPSFPDDGRLALIGLGFFFLFLAALSAFFGQRLAAFAQRFGLGPRVLVPREGLICLGMMLIIAVAALTGGNPDTGNMLLLVFGLMAGGFVLNGWVVVAMLSHVIVSRTLPNSTSAGSVFTVEVSLTNRKRWLSSRLIEVRDLVLGDGVRAEPRVIFVRIAPEGTRSAGYQLSLPRRGLYRFGPLRLSSRFPLGIGERGQSIEQPAELFVYPAIGRLLPAWQQRDRCQQETHASSTPRYGLLDDEFHSIREYRPGDNRRAVHWRSSARHTSLMVREHQQNRQTELVLLLDLCSSAAATAEDLEFAISFAATLCVEQAQRSTAGQHRLLIAGQELQDVDVQGAGAFREAALRSLATCVPGPAPPLRELLQAVTRSQTTSRQLILITPRPETAREALSALAATQQRFDQQLLTRLEILPCLQQQLAAWFIDHRMLQTAGRSTPAPGSTAAPTVPTNRPGTGQ